MAEHDLNNSIEKINPSTYRFKLGDDDVEIGDIKSAQFKPHIKLNRWGKECSLGIGLPNLTFSPNIQDNKVNAENSKLKVFFYPLKSKGQSDFGGAEFEILLKKKPLSNSISFDIDVTGLELFYQPPLTEDVWPKGAIITETDVLDKQGNVIAHRPENVVGSYAILHASKQRIYSTNSEAEKYKAGIAFHLYRPEVIDAKGKKTWADLNFDKQANILTLSINQNWLDSAEYPVKIDPNFGYETGGASAKSIHLYMYGCFFECGGNGTATSISWYLTTYDVGDAIKVAIYDSDKVKLAEGGPLVAGATATQYWLVTLDSNPEVSNGSSYWLTGRADGALVYCYYTTVGGWSYMYKELAYGDFPEDPLVGTFTTGRKFSVYCTYEEAGAARRIFITHQ